MKRVPVPDGNGGELGWFSLKDISELTSDHQEKYLDLIDELRDKKRYAVLPPAGPLSPLDPADDTPVRLSRKDLGPLRDLVRGWMLAESSYGMPLPSPLPLVAANVLRDALEPAFSALNGDIPKENPGSASTSTPT